MPKVSQSKTDSPRPGCPSWILPATTHDLSFSVPMGETLGKGCFILYYLVTLTCHIRSREVTIGKGLLRGVAAKHQQNRSS